MLSLAAALVLRLKYSLKFFFEVAFHSEKQTFWMMGALKSTVTPGIFESILSFLDDSSHVAVCGPGSNDVANMDDLSHFFVGTCTRSNNCRIQVVQLYEESMLDEWSLAVSDM